MSLVEIALFPIPGSVSFPFAKVPLHVFEPRYRRMIHDSVAAQRRIGVAHVRKTISDPKINPRAPLEERLNANQKTYLQHDIFSAGFAKIIETLPDGRMAVEIEMDGRYKSVEEIQSLPYRILNCEPFADIEVDDGDDESAELQQQLQRELHQILITKLGSEHPELGRVLADPKWVDQSVEEYSFRIYSVIGFEPDLMQKVLELRKPSERISFLKDVFTRGSNIH